MRNIKLNYFLPIFSLCFLIVTGCSSSGGSTGSNNSQGNGTSPQVTYIVNANGATDVPVNTKSNAFFTTEMDPSSINSSTLILKQGPTPVLGDVTYNGLGAVVTPLHNLAPYATYTDLPPKTEPELGGEVSCQLDRLLKNI